MSEEMTDRGEKPSIVARWLAMQKENMAKDTSVSAFLANGLDELRQAVQPGFFTQVGAGNNPGVWGSITTGEATTERLEGAAMSAQPPPLQAPEVAAVEAPEAQKSILGYDLPNVPMQQENDRSRGR